MAGSIGYATLSVIPNAKDFGAALTAQTTPGMTAAGATLGKSLMVGIAAAVTVGVGGVVGLFKVGETFDKMNDTIRVGTGATGAALDGLTASARNVGKNVPASFGDIGTAIADLNTRTGQTGPGLENLAAQMLEMTRLTGGDLSSNIASVTRVFGDWGVATGDQAGTMDYLFKVSQSTGIGIDSLSSKVVQFGAPLRQLGFSFEESAAMLGKWEKEGVNTEAVLAGMKIGLGQMSKAGKEPVQALKDVQAAIAGAGSAGEANQIAIATFGQRAGPDMAAAIREGRFSIDELMGTLDASGETILGAAGDTEDFAEKWLKFKNNVLIKIEPIATRVFDAIGKGMDWISSTGAPALAAFGAAMSEKLMPVLSSIGGFLNETAIPAIQGFVEEFRKGEGPGGTFRDILTGVYEKGIVPLAGFITGTAIPAVQDLVRWIGENGEKVKVLAGVITTLLLPVFVSMGVKAVVSAALQVGAWVAAQAGATKSAAVQFIAHYKIVAGWVASAAAAIVSGAETVAIWALYKIEAIKGAAVTVASHARIAAAWLASKATAVASMAVTVATMVAGWAVMGAQALLGAAKVALAWIIALGPVGLVIAAVVGLTVLVVANWDKIVAWTKQAWENVTKWLSVAWANIKSGVTSAWNGILTFFRAIPGRVTAFFQNWTLLGLLIKHWDSIKSGATTGFNAVVDFIRGVPQRIINSLGNLGSLLLGAGRSIISGLLGGLREKFEDVKNFIGGIGSWIADNKGPKSYDLALLVPAGGWLIQGLEDGIRGAMPSLERTLDGVTAKVSGAQIGGVGAAAGRGSATGGGVVVNIDTVNGANPREVASAVVQRMRDANLAHGVRGVAAGVS